MSWQCERCNHWTANGERHKCFYDRLEYLETENAKLMQEVADLKARIDADEDVIAEAERIAESWDISNVSCVVPKHHPGEIAPNDSLAAMAIVRVIHALEERRKVRIE
jgi:cell division septum initiation protein DivIVA